MDQYTYRQATLQFFVFFLGLAKLLKKGLYHQGNKQKIRKVVSFVKMVKKQVGIAIHHKKTGMLNPRLYLNRKYVKMWDDGACLTSYGT